MPDHGMARVAMRRRSALDPGPPDAQVTRASVRGTFHAAARMGAVLTSQQRARLRHLARQIAELHRLREARRLERAAQNALAAGESFEDWYGRECAAALRLPVATARNARDQSKVLILDV